MNTIKSKTHRTDAHHHDQRKETSKVTHKRKHRLNIVALENKQKSKHINLSHQINFHVI